MDIQPGKEATVKVKVKNTGNIPYTFGVGLTLKGPKIYDIPKDVGSASVYVNGSFVKNISGNEIAPVDLNPNESKEVSIRFKMPSNAPEGSYDVGVAVWKKTKNLTENDRLNYRWVKGLLSVRIPSVAYLTVTSNPPGARVFWNRKFIGETPLYHVAVSPFGGLLEVRKSGYPNWGKSITLTPGQEYEVNVNFQTYPRTVSRGRYSFTVNNAEQERYAKDMLGISPPGLDVDTYLKGQTKEGLENWKNYWVGVWTRLGRRDIANWVIDKYNEYKSGLPPSPPKAKIVSADMYPYNIYGTYSDVKIPPRVTVKNESSSAYTYWIGCSMKSTNRSDPKYWLDFPPISVHLNPGEEKQVTLPSKSVKEMYSAQGLGNPDPGYYDVVFSVWDMRPYPGMPNPEQHRLDSVYKHNFIKISIRS